jgi:hypothetical protein
MSNLTETQALLLKLARQAHAATHWAERHLPHQRHAVFFEACEHEDCVAARRLAKEEP